MFEASSFFLTPLSPVSLMGGPCLHTQSVQDGSLRVCVECGEILEEDYSLSLVPDVSDFLQTTQPRAGAVNSCYVTDRHKRQAKLTYRARSRLDLRLALHGLLISLDIPIDPIIDKAFILLDRLVSMGKTDYGERRGKSTMLAIIHMLTRHTHPLGLPSLAAAWSLDTWSVYAQLKHLKVLQGETGVGEIVKEFACQPLDPIIFIDRHIQWVDFRLRQWRRRDIIKYEVDKNADHAFTFNKAVPPPHRRSVQVGPSLYQIPHLTDKVQALIDLAREAWLVTGRHAEPVCMASVIICVAVYMHGYSDLIKRARLRQLFENDDEGTTTGEGQRCDEDAPEPLKIGCGYRTIEARIREMLKVLHGQAKALLPDQMLQSCRSDDHISEENVPLYKRTVLPNLDLLLQLLTKVRGKMMMGTKMVISLQNTLETEKFVHLPPSLHRTHLDKAKLTNLLSRAKLHLQSLCKSRDISLSTTTSYNISPSIKIDNLLILDIERLLLRGYEESQIINMSIDQIRRTSCSSLTMEPEPE